MMYETTKEIIDNIINSLQEKEDKSKETTDPTIGVTRICGNNVVEDQKLHHIQGDTLRDLKKYLAKTYGPMGSYTLILKGDNPQNIFAEYSKDGMKVLKNIIFDSPIEMSIQSEILEVTKHVETKVGDGTTSAVILSSLIYDGLDNLKKRYNVPPRIIIEKFKEIVNLGKSLIDIGRRDINIEDIYNICMISTNGNTDISNKVASVYKEFGFDVNIDVMISNDEDTKIKVYDGLTIEEGYADPAYINNPITGAAEIHNANIYAFQDPIDTPEMVKFLEKIIIDNIMVPISESEDPVPTVIIAPKISRDATSIMTNLVSLMYKYDETKAQMQKPPILIVTNISGIDESVYLDIARLCNCKYIRKYIDPEIQKADQEKGDAPTFDTIHQFAGSAELVSSDIHKTKFINPLGMVDDSKAYDTLLNFLRSELQNAKDSNEDDLVIGRIRKRLKCLESNIVDFMVGGISVSDRDSLRDLVEDAVKNCASAAEYGVGFAANYEGLRVFWDLAKDYSYSGEIIGDLKVDIIRTIFNAYYEAAKTLYGTVVLDRNKLDQVIIKSIENGCPFDVMTLFNHPNTPTDDLCSGSNVICSIRTDIEILDAISKIVTIMDASNQCLLQSTLLNRY